MQEKRDTRKALRWTSSFFDGCSMRFARSSAHKSTIRYTPDNYRIGTLVTLWWKEFGSRMGGELFSKQKVEEGISLGYDFRMLWFPAEGLMCFIKEKALIVLDEKI